MKQSEQIDQLATALAAIQAEVPAIPKGADNPFFKSKYADLADVVAKAQPIASKHGIAVSQDPEFDGEHDLLTTTIMHVSGQWKSATMRLYLPKADPQGQGSAITYAKRYAYMAALNLVADADDDGNAASRAPQKPTTPRRETHGTVRQPPAREETGEMASQKQLGMIGALFREKNFLDDRTVRHAYVSSVVGREFASTKELTTREASLVIKALQAEPVQGEAA